MWICAHCVCWGRGYAWHGCACFHGDLRSTSSVFLRCPFPPYLFKIGSLTEPRVYQLGSADLLMGTSLSLRTVPRVLGLEHGFWICMASLLLTEPSSKSLHCGEHKESGLESIELFPSLVRPRDKRRRKCVLGEPQETECVGEERMDSGGPMGLARVCTAEQGRAREPLSHQEAAWG